MPGAEHDPSKRRLVKPFSFFRTAATVCNQRLRQLGHAEIDLSAHCEELIGARLYTGPLCAPELKEIEPARPLHFCASFWL